MRIRAAVTSIALVASSAVVVVVGAEPATAAETIPVTIAADIVANDGQTSLREAVTLANASGNQDTTIDVDDGLDPVLTRCGTGVEDDDNTFGDLDLADPERVFFTGQDGRTVTQTCPGQRIIHHTNAGGELWLSRMRFTGGDATSNGGGVLSQGALVVSLGGVLVGNHADGNGGGGWAGSFASISQGNVRDNTANGTGGGVQAGTTVTLNAATVAGNAAAGVGGGFFAGSGATINRSTLTQNRGASGGGGRAGGSITVTTSTVYANRAGSGANLTAPGGVNAVASIIALGSGSSDCNQAGGVSGGYNVGADGSCGAAVSGDGPHVHPMLGPLSSVGAAFTPVRRPVPGSPAIDRDPAPCVGEAQDQQLVVRNADGACSSGAIDTALPVCTASGFPDVGQANQFAHDVCWLAKMGITGGYADGGFHPSDAVTRQSMSAFIFRLAGAPLFPRPTGAVFSDVGPAHPFATEIAWMADTGIAEGFQDGSFKGGAAVTRQAMSAFLYRVAGVSAFDPPATPSFPDVSPAHPFYEEVEWLASTAITGGYGDGTFRPASPVSRQAMAAFLHRLAADVPVRGL